MFNNVGFVGSRPIAQALAHHLVAAQISVRFSNSRGPCTPSNRINPKHILKGLPCANSRSPLSATPPTSSNLSNSRHPQPGPGQVLVEVRAVTINTSDFLYIRGVGDRRVQNRCAVAAMGET